MSFKREFWMVKQATTTQHLCEYSRSAIVTHFFVRHLTVWQICHSFSGYIRRKLKNGGIYVRFLSEMIYMWDFGCLCSVSTLRNRTVIFSFIVLQSKREKTALHVPREAWGGECTLNPKITINSDKTPQTDCLGLRTTTRIHRRETHERAAANR